MSCWCGAPSVGMYCLHLCVAASWRLLPATGCTCRSALSSSIHLRAAARTLWQGVRDRTSDTISARQRTSWCQRSRSRLIANHPANAVHRETGLWRPSRGGITSIGKSWGNSRPPILSPKTHVASDPYWAAAWCASVPYWPAVTSPGSRYKMQTTWQ